MMTNSAPLAPSAKPAAAPRARGLSTDFARLAKLWPYLKINKRLIVAAGLLIPVISGLQTALPLILKHCIDHGIIEKNSTVLLQGAAVYLVAVIGEYLSRASQGMCSSLAVHRMIRTMRAKLFTHVLELKAAYHDKSLSGMLVTRATSDFDNLSESLNMGVLTSVVDIAVLIGCLGGMFALNWRLALVALVILPLVWWVVQAFSKGLKSSMLKARVKIAALNGYTQECFYGHTTVKVLTGESTSARRHEKLNLEYRDAQMGSVVLDAWMFAVLDGIASVTVGLILWLILKGTLLSMGGGNAVITAGVLVAFVQYVQQLFEPLKQLGNKMAMLQGAFTSIERIFGLFDHQDKIGGNEAVARIDGAVEFRDVTFSYDVASKVDTRTLKNVSFKLPAGQSLAIVGATGSGKSTIIKLLAKLYDGYEGEILIDGRDIRQLSPDQLRAQIAIVPQDIVLFDGTVAFNIGLGHDSATPERIAAAAREVGADLFLARLPGGLDFLIKEQGGNLSHGQKQLIAFARALARDPGLIVLDEATSSIDPESEAIVQAATQRLLKGRSVVVIAHRLSTIRQCDQILVIDKGVIAERGNHAELVAQGGAYAGLLKALH